MAAEYRIYDVVSARHGTPEEEWAPHAAQTEKSFEWWYLTNVLKDEDGKTLFQHIILFHFAGSNYLKAMGLDPKAGQGHFVANIALSDYERGLRIEDLDFAKIEGIFDSERNAVSFKGRETSLDWQFQGPGMAISGKTKRMELDLKLSNLSGSIWNRDSIFNTEGLIAESAREEPSFYYFIPTLPLTGTVAYQDGQGNKIIKKVTGEGWMERQWGDFMTKSWEWCSMRFNDGDRVNLYAFPQTRHKIGCYGQKDGPIQYFENFSLQQKAYFQARNGVWLASSWEYDLPIKEKKYTVDILSRQDVMYGKANTLVEALGELRNAQGELVGYCVNESMDLQVTGTGPYKNII